MPRLAEAPRDRVGVLLPRHFLDRWEADDTLEAILRAAATHPEAAQRMRDIFAEQLLPVARELGADPRDPATRAALAASQALGVDLTRCVLRLPAIAELDRDELVVWIASTLQRYRTGDPSDGPLRQRTQEPESTGSSSCGASAASGASVATGMA